MLKQTSPFRYGVGMFGTSLPINMFRSFASAFYCIALGLPLEKLSLVVFIYTFLDAIDNPIYGILSDNTRTKIGRRKPWLIIGTPIFVVAFILFFSPPAALQQNGLFVWALIFYCITGTLDSLINANYGALFPELFPNDKIRAKTNSIRQVCQLVAMIIGIALTPMITDALTKATNVYLGFMITAIVYGVVQLAVVLYMAFGVHEPPVTEIKNKVEILPAILAMIKSKNFWIAGAANAFYSAAMGLVMASVPFFVLYSLSGNVSSTYILGPVIVLAIGGVVGWSQLVKKIGAVMVWRIAFVVLALAFVPLYFANNLWSAIVSSAFVGIGFSGVISTMDIIGAKVMDEDYIKYGIKREGIYSSAMGFMNRLSGLFISLAYLLTTKLYGFESGDVPGTRPGDAAKFLIALYPFVLMLCGIAFTWFVKFKNINREDIESGNSDMHESLDFPNVTNEETELADKS